MCGPAVSAGGHGAGDPGAVDAGLLEAGCVDVDPQALRRLLSQIAPALGGSAPVLLAAGRTTRLVTPAQRKALIHRDKGCVYPGCDRPADWCDAHHLREWIRDGGSTDIDNLALVCRFHHGQLHRAGESLAHTEGGFQRVSVCGDPSAGDHPASEAPPAGEDRPAGGDQPLSGNTLDANARTPSCDPPAGEDPPPGNTPKVSDRASSGAGSPRSSRQITKGCLTGGGRTIAYRIDRDDADAEQRDAMPTSGERGRARAKAGRVP
jgi:hypothetical protein